MITLNLTVNGKEQERIKEYLEANASKELADKINNGTPFTKNGKTFTNKKDLNGFLYYARAEAQKQAAKGATCAMVEDEVVFGWAIHYFEEESIEGTLYTLDGEVYKPTKQTSKTTPKPTPKHVESKKKDDVQQTMFDMFEGKDEEEETIDETIDDEDPEETIETPSKPISPLLAKYREFQSKYPGAIIAMRVGDFFEIFGDEAVEVANKTELILTGRDLGLEHRTEMVGFPYHMKENYIKWITAFIPLVMVDQDDIHYYSTDNQEIDAETGEIITELRDGNINDERDGSTSVFISLFGKDKVKVCRMM